MPHFKGNQENFENFNNRDELSEKDHQTAIKEAIYEEKTTSIKKIKEKEEKPDFKEKLKKLSKKLIFKRKTYENLKREYDLFNHNFLQNK